MANRSVGGTPARARRAGSFAQASGRYKRHWTGRLPRSVLSERLTATWQLACLPNGPQYGWATPTECWPFLGNPVPSTLQ